MKYSQIALNAARWAWDQIGCAYSQANRTQASMTEGYIGTPGIDRLRTIRNVGLDYVLR